MISEVLIGFLLKKLLDARAERAIEALLVRGIAVFHSGRCAAEFVNGAFFFYSWCEGGK